MRARRNPWIAGLFGLGLLSLGAYRAGGMALTRATGVAARGVVTRTFVRHARVPMSYSVLDVGGAECTVLGRVAEVGETVALHHPAAAPSECVVDDPPRVDPSLVLMLMGTVGILVSLVQARRARAISPPLALPPDPSRR